MNLKINRNWRHWKNKQTHSSSFKRDVGGEEREAGAGQSPNSSKVKYVPTKAIKKSTPKPNSKANNKYNAPKELNTNNSVVSKENKQYDENKINKKANDIIRQLREMETDENTLRSETDKANKNLDSLYEFETALSFTAHGHRCKQDIKDNEKLKQENFKHNEHYAESLGIQYYTSRNRRYGTEFANLIGKLAEDNSGADIDGDEFWDERLLTERVVTRQAINKCKKDRIKERIVLMLDTSPSCKKVASFYGLLAMIAAKYDDIEVYDCPNGRIVHKYCRRTKEFIPIWNEEDILNNAHDWKYFKNRTILLFGDSDCNRTVRKNLDVNNIIFMCHTNKNDSRRAHAMGSIEKALKNSNNKIFFDIKSPDNLMEVIRKLK